MNFGHQLVDVETGEVIIPKLAVADTFWRRFRGLQFRRPLAPGEGLLLTPCASIHTHWMRFSIDAAMLDENGRVLAIYPCLPPWRIARRVAGTRSVIESACGTLAARIDVGTRVAVSSGT